VTLVKIEDVIDHLESDFKKALAETMKKFAPDIRFNEAEAFRFFLGRVYNHCRVWEPVPDRCVKP
jgi:hypothetical protein